MVSYLGNLAKKCKVLRVARIRSVDDRDYYFGGIKLDRVDVEKDQRVLVSQNLSWNNHVDLTSSKSQRMLNVLYRTCMDMNDISTKKLLYNAWVRSRLEYASVVWSRHTKRNTNNLNKFNEGLQDLFLEGIILSTSAL